jgi:type I site-specific restriction-modification system R (restriction) subunit
MMAIYSTPKNYQDRIIEKLKGGDGEDSPDLLIVVDKLLTGFDVPRNAVLYIDKRLKEHNILQAIARVNRVFEHKDYGLVIDYRGIFGEMTDALEIYDQLERDGFDREDVEGALVDVRVEIAKWPTLHAAVWDVFKGVNNLQDTESLQQWLEPQDRRDEFYEALFSISIDRMPKLRVLSRRRLRLMQLLRGLKKLRLPTAGYANERMEEDPVLYLRVSQLIQTAIDDRRAKRLSDIGYLQKMQSAMEMARSGGANTVPAPLQTRPQARAFYNVFQDKLDSNIDDSEVLVLLSIGIEEIVTKHKIRDWQHNQDIKKQMMNEIDDLVHDLKKTHNLFIAWSDLDELIAKIFKIAENYEVT